MPFNRLDDKIHELCARALASQDPAELHEIVTQLSAALQECNNRIPLAANSYQPERRGAVIRQRPALSDKPSP